MKPWAAMVCEPKCVLVFEFNAGIRRVSTSRFMREIDRKRLDRFRADGSFITAHHLQFEPALRSIVRRTDVIGRPYLAVNTETIAALALTEGVDLWTLVSKLFIYRPDAARALAHTIALVRNTPGVEAVALAA